MADNRRVTIRPAPIVDAKVKKYQDAKGISTWTGALFALVEAGLKAETKQNVEKAQST